MTSVPQDRTAPLISVVVPVFDPPVAYLTAMIESVRGQTWTDWELVLVDDASSDAAVVDRLTAVAAEPQVVVITRPGNGGIVAATNAGIAAAAGDFIALVDHDDVLAPNALERVASAFADPRVDLVYTDEAHLTPDGEPGDAFRKPDFSPERLRGQMYINHLSVYRRSLLDELGGLRTGFDGSQDYDLVLRATERSRAVVHIPEVLYHWRIHPASVSQRVDNAPVFASATRALNDHLRRVGIDAVSEQVHPVGVYRTRRRVRGRPLVSLVVPSRGSWATIGGQDRCMVLAALRSVVEKSSYDDIEVVVVLDSVAPDSVADELTAMLGDRLRLIDWQAPFNFSAKVNRGVLAARGEFVVLLNDDVEVITPEWLEVMIALAQQDDVGMVGPMLYFEDGSIQHAGQAIDREAPGHIGWGWPHGSTGPFAAFLVEREVSGVTAACAVIRRDLYLELGGMSMELPVNFNDVDLGQKVLDAGFRIVWTPFAELFHYESRSRVAQVISHEINTLNDRWGRRVVDDPFWHHHAAEGVPRQ